MKPATGVKDLIQWEAKILMNLLPMSSGVASIAGDTPTLDWIHPFSLDYLGNCKE